MNYLAGLESYLDWVVAQPMLDLPETGGARQYDAGATPSVDDQVVENEDLRDLLESFARAHGESTQSASARMPSGINTHDEGRIRTIVAKARAFLTDYVDQTEPVDLPQSTPPVS